MDLPVFHDNLRSSAGWVAEVDEQSRSWREAPAEVRSRVKALTSSALSETAVAMQDAAELVSTWALDTTEGLDAARLIQLYRVLIGATGAENHFRLDEAQRLSQFHDPAPAVLIPRLLDNALDWFQTPSFGELHPLEQAALVHLRLLDLQPFATANREIAWLAASFYTERSGLPPLVFFDDSDAVKNYEAAIEAAFRMLTQPLVEFLAQSLLRTIRTVLA